VAVHPAATLARAQEDGRLYELTFHYYRSGPQGGRLEAWTQETMLPLLAEHGSGPAAVFRAEIGENTPFLVTLVEHASSPALASTWAQILADERWQRGLSILEAAPDAPFDRAERRLLRATDYSPPLSEALGQSDVPRLFEYRLYQSPSQRQLQALHERFAGPEIPLFHTSGIFPVMYGETIYGPDLPSLVYLTPFTNFDAREKAWATFRNDPEWQRVLAESKANDGEIVAYIHRSMLMAAPYSPLK
jgi:hypothetical protein